MILPYRHLETRSRPRFRRMTINGRPEALGIERRVGLTLVRAVFSTRARPALSLPANALDERFTTTPASGLKSTSSVIVWSP